MPLLKILLLPILFVFAIPITSNKEPVTNHSSQELFRYLRCHRQAKNIVVNWGMTSQAGVSRYIVYHSEDNDFFDPVAEIPVDNAESKYSFKHLNVFPGYHYYYIAAVRSGLPNVNSITDVVRIVAH